MDKLTKYLFFGFSFFLSIKTSIGNFFIILIITSFLIEFITTKKKSVNLKIIGYSFVPIFLFSTLSLLWSTNVTNGLDLSAKHLTLFLVPIAFSLTPLKNNETYLKYSYYGLLIGALTLSLLLFIKLGFRLINLENFNINRIFSSHQTSHKYTLPILKTHPSYLGFYALLSLAVLIFNKIKINFYAKSIFIIILIVNIIFLNARILFFLMSLLLLIKIVLISSLRIKLVLVSSLVLIFIASLFLLRNTYIYKKLIKGSFWEITHNVGTSNTTDKYPSDSRLVRWKAAIEGTKNNRLIGSGLGTEIDVLLPMYKKNKLIVSHYRKFNTHNQYLYYFVVIGFVGVLLFLILLGNNIILSINNKDVMMFYFFISLFMISLVENIVYRNAGFTFLSVYLSLYNKQYLNT